MPCVRDIVSQKDIERYVMDLSARPSDYLARLRLLRLFGSEPHHSLQALAKKYNPVILLHLGKTLDRYRHLLASDLSFASRSNSSIADRFFYHSQEVGFGKYGEPWRQMRRIAMLHLLSQRQALAFRKVRELEGAVVLIAKICVAAGLVNLSDMIIDFTSILIYRRSAILVNSAILYNNRV
ncbi:cytochrome P450 71A24-like [Zingiber officinale]|uniref:cytochrome P450 71A24-like n=1 Tax=Zingiber officinale TaxID=94328 RepID=UPI001C4D2357|nr:cytochrome P450 71A24-like [Zingiber officinale]